MQIVTFKCGRCGKLIGVGEEYLGRQVRCLHCRGIVLAQQSSAAESATQTAKPFSAPTLFLSDSLPTSHAVSAPAELAVPIRESTIPDTGEQAAAPSLSESGAVNSAPAEANAPGSSPSASESTATAPPLSPIDSSRHEHASPSFSPNATGSTVARGRRLAARTPLAISIWYVIPLVSYSLLATILLAVLWNRLQAVEDHPLIAFLPDSEGDAPGVVRKPKGVNEARKRKLIGDPLPESLKLHLGETRTIGALAITPERVVREQVGVGDGASAPEKLTGLSLVLHLKLENVSSDESFQPLDRFFDRKWREGSSAGAPPLTLLEAGPGRRFFGGPAEWRPRPAPARNNSARPEFIYLMGGDKPVEDPIDHRLGPGERTRVFVCTDGNDTRTAGLAARKGDFLWRVHLRRGLVRVREHDVPAAAVVGVAFTDRDIGGG
jgi:DNA-directed RNA polymerase subunit RPC12/RpoP